VFGRNGFGIDLFIVGVNSLQWHMIGTSIDVSASAGVSTDAGVAQRDSGDMSAQGGHVTDALQNCLAAPITADS
jgi:hypothetical protein